MVMNNEKPPHMPSDEPTRRAWTYHYAGRIATIGSSLSMFPWDKTELLLAACQEDQAAQFREEFFPSLTRTIPGLLVSRLAIGFSPFGRPGWIKLAASIINWNWWVRTFGPTLVRDQGGNKGGVDLLPCERWVTGGA
jgi:hypothetical protein